MAGDGCARKTEAGRLKETCATSEEAGSSKATEATGNLAAAGAEDAPPAPITRRKMYMSPEDIGVILSHKARGDSFKQFQARIRKELAETGYFEISEEYVNKVFQHRARIRQEWSNLRSQYPNLVWEEDGDDDDDNKSS